MSTTIEEKPNALAVVEPASQLITIEPAKYVALVFEPFQKRLDAAKMTAKTVTYDIATASGMRAAIELRAMFRDIRIGSEKARKERKAPILEIGKLLDSRHKEIEAEIEPFEKAPDDAIKAEEKRKDDEKIAKALAESQRITKIRLTIDTIRHVPTDFIGKPSVEIGVAADHLSEQVISLDFYAEYTSEATAERDNAVKQLRAMQDAMRAHEDAAAELARKQAELAEQERLAAVARAEQEARDQAERERVAAEQLEAAEKASAAMRAEQVAHQARMAAQQAELDAKQAVIDAAIAEQERVAREAREAAEAVERRRQEEADAAARVEAERIQAEKDAAAAAELAEAARQLAERQAREAAAAEEERQARAAREAADTAMRNAASALYAALISQVSWAGELTDEFLDGEPGLREQFAADRKAAADALKLARGEA